LQRLKLFVIGVKSGDKDFVSKDVLRILESCSGVFLSKRFFEQFKEFGFKDKLVVFPDKLKELPENIKEFSKSLCEDNSSISVLATGDPNFFGITSFLKRNLPDAEIIVKPNVSTMQEAFAKLSLNWEDAAFFSLHGRQKESVTAFVLKNSKGFLFTSSAEDVLYLLKILKDLRLDDYIVYIFEDIGTENETITELSFPFLIKKPLSNLNVVIFLRNNPLGSYPGIGLLEECYKYKAGMITKKELRSNIISLLTLREGNVIWDIGAGSGSVSIEATFNPVGTLSFAIEKDEEAYLNLKENIKTFSAFNVKPIFADFSSVYSVLPPPDRIFIGGGKIKTNLPLAFDALKKNGVMVIALVSIDNLLEAITFFDKNDVKYSLVQINVAKKEDVKKASIMKASNPVYLLRAEKQPV